MKRLATILLLLAVNASAQISNLTGVIERQRQFYMTNGDSASKFWMAIGDSTMSGHSDSYPTRGWRTVADGYGAAAGDTNCDIAQQMWKLSGYQLATTNNAAAGRYWGGNLGITNLEMAILDPKGVEIWTHPPAVLEIGCGANNVGVGDSFSAVVPVMNYIRTECVSRGTLMVVRTLIPNGGGSTTTYNNQYANWVATNAGGTVLHQMTNYLDEGDGYLKQAWDDTDGAGTDIHLKAAGYAALATNTLNFLAELWPPTNTWTVASTNVIDWQNQTGVPGGIPTRTTIYTNFTSSATAANINKGIADCPSNQVVKLADGTYTISAEIAFGLKTGVTLRGSGTNTILNLTGTRSIGISTDVVNWNGTYGLASGYTKGSTSVVFSATPSASFAVGTLVQFYQNDDTNFVFKSGGPGIHMRWLHRILSVVGTTMTFEPPLMWTMTAGLSPGAYYQSSGVAGAILCGIEDMTVNNSGVIDNNIYFQNADRCWVSGVTITNFGSSGITLMDSMQNTVSGCAFLNAKDFPAQSDGFGIYCFGVNNTVDGTASFNRIENNIFANNGVGVLFTDASGNAVLYNYGTNSDFSSFVHQTGTFNAGHGPHPMMTLYEGNVAEQFQHDGYHGTASHHTIFRNWFNGLSRYTSNRKMMSLERGSYHFNVAGNILGRSTWSNAASFSYEMVGEGDFANPVIYRLGYPNVANNYTVIPGDIATPWVAPYGEATGNGWYPDTNVLRTLLRHGNYDYKNQNQIWASNDVRQAYRTLSNSMIYAAAPSYWGNCPWPPYDPASPSSAHQTNIPAGYRYVTGQAGGGGGGSPAGATANVGTLRIGP